MIAKQKKKKFSQNAAISGLKYAFEHRDGNPAGGREEMVSRRKGAEKCEWSDDEALVAGGCRTNVQVQDSLLLSLSRSDRRLAFGPQSLWSSPGNMFSSSSALFLLSPSADSRLHLS